MTNLRLNLLFSFADRYANLVIGVVSTIILARLLSPAETGLYSVAAGLINIAQSLREFGVSSYILQEKDLTREKIASATCVCLFIAGLLAILFSSTSHQLAHFYDAPELALIIQVLSLNFIVVAFASIGSAQLRRAMMFRANMVISLVANFVSTATAIVLAALGAGPISLAWGSLAGVSLSAVGNWLALGHVGFARPNLRNWRQLTHFGVFSSGSGLLGALADRTPDLVVARLISLEGTGLFSRGNGLINLFRTALTSAVDPVISSSLAMLHREGGDVRTALLRIFSYLSAIGWPALAVLALLARPTILLLFGPQWIGSVNVAQILCAGAGLSLIGNICQTYLGSTNGVRWNFIIQAVSVPVFVAAVAFGSLIGLEYAALGSAATGALMTVVSMEILRRRIALSWTAMGRSVLPSVVITVLTATPAATVVALHGMEDHWMWLPWTASALCGALSWLGSIRLLRHPLWAEVMLFTHAIGGILKRHSYSRASNG